MSRHTVETVTVSNAVAPFTVFVESVVLCRHTDAILGSRITRLNANQYETLGLAAKLAALQGAQSYGEQCGFIRDAQGRTLVDNPDPVTEGTSNDDDCPF